MPERTRTSQGDPFHITKNPLSWAAGVLDACGVFTLRKYTHRPGRFTTHVSASCPKEVSKKMIELLGAGEVTKARGYWRLPAKDQKEVLEKVLPWMRTSRQRKRAETVVRLRVTQAGKGGRLSKQVSILREALARKEEMHG